MLRNKIMVMLIPSKLHMISFHQESNSNLDFNFYMIKKNSGTFLSFADLDTIQHITPFH